MEYKSKRILDFIGCVLIIAGFLLHLSGVLPLGVRDLVMKIMVTIGIVVFSISNIDNYIQARRAGKKDVRILTLIIMYLIFAVVIWLPIGF